MRPHLTILAAMILAICAFAGFNSYEEDYGPDLSFYVITVFGALQQKVPNQTLQTNRRPGFDFE